LSISQDKRFQKLDADTQAIVNMLIDARTSQSKELSKHFEQLGEWQRREHEETRRAFVYIDGQKRKNRVELGLLESLRFPTMSVRYDRVVDAHEKTFQWIFHDPHKHQKPWDSFGLWLSQESGLYWIQGKAASGKSTLMRFIWRNRLTLEKLLSWSKGDSLVYAAFFFWNSGLLEQRSQIGLLRSLLYETLGNRRDLIPEVFKDEWERGSALAAHDMEITPETWTLPQLQKAFGNLIDLAGPKLHMCFFIDGLDEYDGDVEDVAQYFLEMSKKSPYAKFCLSSRPWPEFLDIFQGTAGLKLQDLTYDDIKLYVHDKLEKNKYMQQLLRGDPKNATHLVHELTSKAAGVFLWVFLVVKSLIKGLRNGDNITHLQSRLASVPSDLENLYEHMIKCIEPLYIEESAQIIQIFRASGNFLDIVTLERALRFSDYRQAVEMQIEKVNEIKENRESEDVGFKRIELRLNSRCKGLLEVLIDMNEFDPVMENQVWEKMKSRRNIKSRQQLLSRQEVSGQAQYICRLDGCPCGHAISEGSRGTDRSLIPIYGTVQASKKSSHALTNSAGSAGTTCSETPMSFVDTDKVRLARTKSEVPHISYLHRTVKDYIERPNVWERLVQRTQHSGFDPHTALITAYVVELKTTSLISKAKTIYDGGVEILSRCSGLEPSVSRAHIELVEELDRVVSVRSGDHDPELSHEHWSNGNPAWDRTTITKRQQWKTDILIMAMKSNVNWYVNAKLASTDFIPVKTREGLPLLAFALCFDSWAFEGKATIPSYNDVQFLLDNGANPNEMYESRTIWQYTIHYVHILNDMEAKLADFPRWMQIFKLMLEHGADPYACCIREDSCDISWACSVGLKKGGEMGYYLAAIRDHTLYKIKPWPGEGNSPEDDGNPGTRHEQHHSVTAVVYDVFRIREVPGVEELIKVLEEAKQAAGIRGKRKRKKNRVARKMMRPNWVT
jgi:hypothetical protein